MKHVAVIGAGGYIGGRLVPRLLDKGFAVTIIARHPSTFLNQPWSDSVEICEVALPETRNLRRALDGVDIAYYLPSPMISEHEEVHAELENARAFAAHASGLKKIIVLGRSGQSWIKDRESVSKAAVANILRAAAPVLEIATGPVIGAGSAPFELLRDTVQRLPFVATGPWGSSRVSLIGVQDLLSALVHGANSSAVGIYRCGSSPETLDNIIERFSRQLGHPRRVWSLPWFPIALAAKISSWVSPVGEARIHAMLKAIEGGGIEPDSKSYALMEGPAQAVDTVLLNAIEEDRQGMLDTHWIDWESVPGEDITEQAHGAYRWHWLQSTLAASNEVFTSLISAFDSGKWSEESRLWRFREWLDKLFGGPGFGHPRDASSSLRAGDELRGWRVVELEPNRKLALKSEMKLPGEAYLIFDILEKDGRTEISQTSIFKPRGFVGWLYWWISYPLSRTALIDFADQFIRHAEERTNRSDRRSRA